VSELLAQKYEERVVEVNNSSNTAMASVEKQRQVGPKLESRNLAKIGTVAEEALSQSYRSFITSERTQSPFLFRQKTLKVSFLLLQRVKNFENRSFFLRI